MIAIDAAIDYHFAIFAAAFCRYFDTTFAFTPLLMLIADFHFPPLLHIAFFRFAALARYAVQR
jgi:hypothetical protein